MSDFIQSLLDALPDGVIQLRGGLVLAANEKARQYLPRLCPGAPLPVSLSVPPPGETETGVFVSGGVSYAYSCKAGGEDCMLLFRPDSRCALESWQLDGALRMFRELLGDILAEAGSASFSGGEGSASFHKTFHRLFRLVGNLEFMQQVMGEEGVPFHPVTMDLDGLCQDTARLAGDLLQEAGVTLEYAYKGRTRGLLLPGDPQLLQKLLLSLISNAARPAAESGGRVLLTLSRRGDQAQISVSGSGSEAGGPHVDALLRGGTGDGLPLPGQGAGLGLSVARHIARLHGGRLLPYGGESAPGVLVSLPVGPLNNRLSVRTPPVQRDGGLNPVLMELSDVLPASLFGMEGLD